MTLKEILSWGTDCLHENKIAEAKLDAWYLLEYLTGISRTDFFMNPDKKVSQDIEIKYRQCIEKRKNHYPLQYITNSQQFMGYDFYVDESVLVPRPETEQLVVEAEKYLQHIVEMKKTVGLNIKACETDENRKINILDMCTGSGCIAISIKLRNEICNVTAVDISEAALKTADKNAKNLNADVNFVKSDLFNEFVDEKYDIIVSNPPYIETDEINLLMEEVRDFEPVLALDGKSDGLFFYRKIIDESKKYLNSDGKILFEIGYNQGSAVSDLLSQAGFTDIEVIKDLSGLDRIVSGGMINV